MSFGEALLELINGILGMPIENVEVTDTIANEEGAGHGTVESNGEEKRVR